MKNDAKEIEIKKENKKAMPKLLIIMLACAVLGFFVGMGMAFLSEVDIEKSLFQHLDAFWIASAPWCLPVFALVLLLPSTVLYLSQKSAFSRWDGENEESIERIEAILGIALILDGSFMIFLFFGMAVILSTIDSHSGIVAAICVAEMILTLLWIILMQQKIIDLEKQINPEKKGSVYDTKFNKKWMDSCDEREQLLIFKSAYQAYKVTSNFCMILSLLLMLGSLPFGYGPLPAGAVLLVWLVEMLSYCITAAKLEKNKNKEGK